MGLADIELCGCVWLPGFRYTNKTPLLDADWSPYNPAMVGAVAGGHWVSLSAKAACTVVTVLHR